MYLLDKRHKNQKFQAKKLFFFYFYYIFSVVGVCFAAAADFVAIIPVVALVVFLPLRVAQLPVVKRKSCLIRISQFVHFL